MIDKFLILWSRILLQFCGNLRGKGDLGKSAPFTLGLFQQGNSFNQSLRIMIALKRFLMWELRYAGCSACGWIELSVSYIKNVYDKKLRIIIRFSSQKINVLWPFTLRMTLDLIKTIFGVNVGVKFLSNGNNYSLLLN